MAEREYHIPYWDSMSFCCLRDNTLNELLKFHREYENNKHLSDHAVITLDCGRNGV